MSTVRLRLPTGEEIENPDSEFLTELLLEKDQAFWEYGAGDVGIWFGASNSSADAEMILVLKEPYGVYVQYLAPDEGTEYCLVGGSGEEIRTAYIGGEPMELPAKYLVAREVALQAVEAFTKSGKRASNLPWVRC